MNLREFFITPQGFSDNDLQALEDKTKTDWSSPDIEGQLAVDVYQVDQAIVIKTAIAGVRPEDVKISVHNDVITIRGERKVTDKIKNDDYYYRECYWGKFSRSIILPVEIKQDKIEAIFKNGVLTVILPKAKPEKTVKIKVEE